jgi:hypothetical protein
MEFPYTLDNKHYHTLHYHNLQVYGAKVVKASLDVGLGCPNRDGRVGTGGCCFCEGGSHYFAGSGTVTAQLAAEATRIHKKWPQAGLIAYFQAGTNTYGPLPHLWALWQEALAYPGVVGLSIATRADCLEPEILDALAGLRDQTNLTVELGLQTVHDETARRMGRGHSYGQFLEGYAALQRRGIRTCVHLIDGLPGEGKGEMLETARQVGQLRPGGVKLHLLHVTRGTALGELYLRGEYVPLERTQYVSVVAQQLQYFPPETVIERLTGDGDRTKLLAPLWSRDKIAVLGAIDVEMAQRDIYQGDLVTS